MLTGGQVADCTAGELLLEQMPQASMLHGDKGYDSNAIRRQIEGKGAMPNIPPKANRRWKNCFSPYSIATATPSSACSVASRTSGASPLATTGWPTTSSPLYASSQSPSPNVTAPNCSIAWTVHTTPSGGESQGGVACGATIKLASMGTDKAGHSKPDAAVSLSVTAQPFFLPSSRKPGT